MILHNHSPALSHFIVFCSSAFNSCLVCESTGLHLVLVFMEIRGKASGGDNNIMLHFVL